MVTACGAAPEEEAAEESLGSTSLALDATCSVAFDYASASSSGDGSQITVFTRGTCADGAPLEYRFQLVDPKGKSTFTASTPDPSSFWQLPPGTPQGTHTVTVELRRQGVSAVAAKASKKLIVGGACTNAGITTSPAGGAALGEQVSVQPYFACSPVPYEWRLSVKNPGGGTVYYPWQQEPSFLWDTGGGLNAGAATVSVSARNVGNTVVDVMTSIAFKLGSICNASTLAASGSGSQRTLTATASCENGGTALYRYTATAPNGSVSLLRDFTPEASFAWDVTGLDGSYVAKVEVRAEQSPEQIATTKTVKVNVGTPCTTVTLPDTWGKYPRAQGLSVTATAPCTNPEYQFQRRAANVTTWTTVCPYSSSPTCDLKIADQPVGDYVVRAQVRKVGSIATQDAASAQRELIVTDGIPLLRRYFTDYSTAPTSLSTDGRWLLTSSGRWSRTTGLVKLDRPDDATMNLAPSGGVDFNDTASVIVGWDAKGAGYDAATRSAGSKTNWLTSPQEYYSESRAYATNANGSVIVGYVAASGFHDAFRWTSAGLVRLSGQPGGFTWTYAFDVSGDGKVVVGSGRVGDHDEAFRWTSATGMVGLGVPAGDTRSIAHAISRDGQVIIGQGSPSNRGLRWTAATGWTDLGFAPGSILSRPTAISADGSVIFGTALFDGGIRKPFLWTAATGTRLLETILAEQGVDLTGWNLVSAGPMSSDGKTLGGTDDYDGWLLTLP